MPPLNSIPSFHSDPLFTFPQRSIYLSHFLLLANPFRNRLGNLPYPINTFTLLVSVIDSFSSISKRKGSFFSCQLSTCPQMFLPLNSLKGFFFFFQVFSHLYYKLPISAGFLSVASKQNSFIFKRKHNKVKLFWSHILLRQLLHFIHSVNFIPLNFFYICVFYFLYHLCIL